MSKNNLYLSASWRTDSLPFCHRQIGYSVTGLRDGFQFCSVNTFIGYFYQAFKQPAIHITAAVVPVCFGFRELFLQSHGFGKCLICTIFTYFF